MLLLKFGSTGELPKVAGKSRFPKSFFPRRSDSQVLLKRCRFDYFDDTKADPGSPVDKSADTSKSVYEPAAIAHKNIHVMGVSAYCDEFPESHRTYSRETNKAEPSGSPGVSF